MPAFVVAAASLPNASSPDFVPPLSSGESFFSVFVAVALMTVLFCLFSKLKIRCLRFWIERERRRDKCQRRSIDGMRERERKPKKNRDRVQKTPGNPSWPLLFRPGFPRLKTVDRRREDPARSRKKRKISPPHIGEASLPQIRTQTSVREKNKKQQKQSPAVPVRASVRDGLSERRNRSSGLCGRGKHYACLFVTFAFIYCIYISRVFLVFYRKKKSPSFRRFFFLFFFHGARSPTRGDWRERSFFFCPNFPSKP